MGWGRRNGPGVGVMGVGSGWGAEGCRGRRAWGGGGCSWRVGVRGHETARVLRVGGEGGMPAGARLRSRLILRASRKARLPAVPATGLQAICRLDQRGSLVNAVREQRRVDLARALKRKEGTVGRNSTASASASLRASAAACMCAARKKALALYHERTLAIMTGEPRICTLACTPGATKALADAHARTTRRDLNIFYSDLAEQFRRRRSGS